MRTASTILAVWRLCGSESSIAERIAMRWARTQIQRIPDAIEALMRTFVLGGALHLPYRSLATVPDPWRTIQGILDQPEYAETRQMLQLAGWFDPRPVLHPSIKRALMASLQNPQRADEVLMQILLPTRAKMSDDALLSNPFYAAGANKHAEIATGQVGPTDVVGYMAKVALNRARDVLRVIRTEESRRTGPVRDDEGRIQDPLERIPSPDNRERVEDAALLRMLDRSTPTGAFIYGRIMDAARSFYGSKKRQIPEGVVPPGIQYFEAAFDSIDNGKKPSRTQIAAKIRTPSTDVEKRRTRSVEEGMHERSLSQRHIDPIMQIFADEWDAPEQKKLRGLLMSEGLPREMAENVIRRLEQMLFNML